MISNVILSFIEMWLMGLVALFAGRYIGRGNVVFPIDIGKVLLIYFEVWVIVYIGNIAFSLLGRTLEWRESYQAGFAEFLFPIALAAFFSRQLLRLAMSKQVK